VSGVANINEAAGRSAAPGRLGFPPLSRALDMVRAYTKAAFELAFALDSWEMAERVEYALSANLRGLAERSPDRLTGGALRRLERQLGAEFEDAESSNDWRAIGVVLDLLAPTPISARIARSETAHAPAA
jgi:hypothetical protein